MKKEKLKMKNEDFISEFLERLNTDNDKRVNQNLFYEDNVLFSYGYHFPLCLHLNNGFILNKSKYSVTTSKIQTYTRRILEKKGFAYIELTTQEIKDILNNFWDKQKLEEIERMLLLNKLNGEKINY